MNDVHTPRYWKAFLGVAGGAVVMGASYLIPGKAFWVFLLAGLVSCLIGIAQAAIASYSHVSYIALDVAREKRLLFETYKGATPDEKSLLARIFPEIDVDIVDGSKTYYWRGTNVPVHILQEFLKESDSQCTVAQRNWKARGQVEFDDGSVVDYHWCWLAIYKKLVAMDYVIEASHNGPRSELWRGKAYQKLCDDWLEPLQEMEHI